jgi:hypothetical protein
LEIRRYKVMSQAQAPSNGEHIGVREDVLASPLPSNYTVRASAVTAEAF